MYTLGHFLLSMQYVFVPHTFINSIYAIFYYIAMIPYANSVNASLQYANSVIATLPLCQFSTCHETLWWTYNMTVLRLLQNRRARISCLKNNQIFQNSLFFFNSKESIIKVIQGSVLIRINPLYVHNRQQIETYVVSICLDIERPCNLWPQLAVVRSAVTSCNVRAEPILIKCDCNIAHFWQ